MDYADQGHRLKEMPSPQSEWHSYLRVFQANDGKERHVENKAARKAVEVRCLERGGLPWAQVSSWYLLTWCPLGELEASLGPPESRDMVGILMPGTS